jgi:aminocarboxymuconate-semialdehyde decarboxylase
MDDFPKLKVAIAHGGDYLPFYTGRHDHVQRMGHIGGQLKGSFSSYLKRFNYETVFSTPICWNVSPIKCQLKTS